MSDLISRSELIKKIKDHKDNVKCKNESSNQIYGLAHDHIIELVELQPSKTNWIPVSERLPENNRPVLCWVRSTTIASGETYIIGSCSSGFWFLQTYEIGRHHFPVKDYEVVAWQPLPEPYKEG